MDHYQPASGAYDLFAAPYFPSQLAALEQALPNFLTLNGPILDIGAGSGMVSEQLLQRLPAAQVVAIEPSSAMRSLLLGRIAREPRWFPRITVRPEGVFDAPLPDRLGGALALGVLGHFTPHERKTLLTELSSRISTGGAFLVDLQHPEQPCRVEAYEFTAATVGDLEYRGIAEAWPIGDAMMRWKMTYRVLDGKTTLSEETLEHVYHHPSPQQIRKEAMSSGFDANQLDPGSFWLLVRS